MAGAIRFAAICCYSSVESAGITRLPPVDRHPMANGMSVCVCVCLFHLLLAEPLGTKRLTVDLCE